MASGRGEAMTIHDNEAAQNARTPALATDSPPGEPSEGWGWHGGFPRGSMIAGWATAAILGAMLITHLLGGHHEGHVADVYLAVITTGLMLSLLRRAHRARRSYRY